ncbi:hypothetical protein BegalDRAFT_0692 [Beggiatoa alba B18LD]|uniref:ATPase AAA-type core domain-containing protein n=1 Tax=Beggiatoa alba B18LD TaxID=395493 RepID=I3CDB1_9GAMM|nr:AAA family ATPase [Beggiatoa alba]EIJ41604.1 hypothetical protein BegalDRAFT_0692 [Beggiatoa alba B18LD]
MNRRVFEELWQQLRTKKPQATDFLEGINIKNLRGIKDLTINFTFPVTVIAGANASGKSTLLFACACAYHVEGAGIKDYVPTTLFPNLKTKQVNTPYDKELETAFEFYYIANRERLSMRWAKGKSWNRSYMGKKGGAQPKRQLYLRTLANLTSPSEVRSVLQLTKTEVETNQVTADLLAFAQHVLPMRYQTVQMLSKGDKDLLFATREETNTQYSEFHMSAGERAVLRISKDISRLKNALILIDELEAGLHPFTQQQIMLELQRLAVRNDLQIIVTSHSPVVLESVPLEARIFLERIADNVSAVPAYKNIFQKAFYGQSLEKMSILCEDDIAEAFLLGVLDEINPRLGLTPDDIYVGRDTGKELFPQHIEAIAKFKQLDSFIFVLDGDAKTLDAKLRETGSRFGHSITPLYLPQEIPEAWAWQILKQHSPYHAQALGIQEKDLLDLIERQDKLFDNATDKPTNKLKNKFYTFCESLKRSTAEVMRQIARLEARQLEEGGEMQLFINDFTEQLRRWQARQ